MGVAQNMVSSIKKGKNVQKTMQNMKWLNAKIKLNKGLVTLKCAHREKDDRQIF